MASALFVAADSLEMLGTEGKIEIDGSRLSLLQDGLEFNLMPAAHLVAFKAGSPGDISLLGRVYTMDEIEQMGGIQKPGEITFGTNTYTAALGFLGWPHARANAQPQGAKIAKEPFEHPPTDSGHHPLAVESMQANAQAAPIEPQAQAQEPNLDDDDDLLLGFLQGD